MAKNKKGSKEFDWFLDSEVVRGGREGSRGNQREVFKERYEFFKANRGVYTISEASEKLGFSKATIYDFFRELRSMVRAGYKDIDSYFEAGRKFKRKQARVVATKQDLD